MTFWETSCRFPLWPAGGELGSFMEEGRTNAESAKLNKPKFQTSLREVWGLATARPFDVVKFQSYLFNLHEHMYLWKHSQLPNLKPLGVGCCQKSSFTGIYAHFGAFHEVWGLATATPFDVERFPFKLFIYTKICTHGRSFTFQTLNPLEEFVEWKCHKKGDNSHHHRADQWKWHIDPRAWPLGPRSFFVCLGM